MNLPRLAAAFALGAFGLLSLAGTASAATAYASERISIWSDPASFSPIVGMLRAGETVRIDRCTPSGKWCRVFHHGPTGWVPGSYLVGAAAKNDATPLRSLASPNLNDQRDLGHRKSGGFLF